MSQSELADAVKQRYPHARVTQQNIAYLEKGNRRTSYIAELAVILHVHTDWLALGIEPRKRNDLVPFTTSDPKLVAVLKLMQDMPEYQKDQAVKIVDAIAQPPNDRTRAVGE